jgi:threonine dehydrogenase-like Zn-dependent dehydrogenase
MKAVTCQEGRLEIVDLPAPEPAKGQVVLTVHRCGICGSDLHARHHADEQADVLAEAGYPDLMRSHQQVVFGHEFSGEVAEYGPGTRKTLPVGSPVVAMPLRRRGGEVHAIGLSAKAPGAYAEQVLVEESLMFPLPNGLSPDLAVLTEPLADILIDPGLSSPYEAAGDQGFLTTVPALVELGISTMEQLTGQPDPWHHVMRMAMKMGAGPSRPVIFECVGIPGMIDGVITGAPLGSRVVVAGVCMQPDTIRPAMAINKEIDLRFVVGYTPLEFWDTLNLLADGKVNAVPIVTGTVGLGGVEAAFAALAEPEHHAKIVIDPRGDANVPVPT